MDYKDLVKKLNNLEAIAYGYNINGEVLGMDCSDFEQIVVDSAEAITELLARAETADAQRDAAIKELDGVASAVDDLADFIDEQKCLEQVEVEKARAEKAERERDAAISDLRRVSIENCAECMYCLYKTAKSFCWNCRDGSNWKWKGLKGE